MAIGDKVRVGIGTMIHGVDSSTNVPVYEFERNSSGMVIFDMAGCAMPKPLGGVKGGSIGKVVGDPTKVHRSSIQVKSGVDSSAGNDTILLYPVEFEYYKQVAFVSQDHLHVVG